MDWLPGFRATIGADNHKTSPIVWFENPEGNKYLGGRDDTLAWAKRIFSVSDNLDPTSAPNIDIVDPSHTYDYDLVIIGGGSGGLACSKEAQKLGARVAVLDFVKPSPHGTTWGLGGTCVNVGCIPKKLMHISATHGEHMKDSKGFGWNTSPTHCDWLTLRDNVRDHIKGLNFGYRVQLREAGVTYLNALGKFIGPHELECTDGKGKTKVITSARFVIATGGRPTPLEIPGGEHAITSDDIFYLDHAPGKTCVVGAGYVALECAGFVAGLEAGETKVLVRSKPLRTFDQDTVQYVVDYMTKKSGVQIIEGALPKSIEKLPNGKLLVSYKDVEEEFDTVLAAIGRTPDLSGLNLSALSPEGLAVDPKSGKIRCVHEQTSVPHVYAIGDIVQGAPELTPVAILAGKLLARRLFGNSSETICYTDIATAVFTPLELGTVGLSEEQAIDAYGEENVDSYISSFTPLEWTLADNYHGVSCFAKIIVTKKSVRV
jgi:thioredoxin reductase (NADPH)